MNSPNIQRSLQIAISCCFLFGACFCELFQSPCKAQPFPALVDWTGEVGEPDSPGIIGWAFTTNEPILVTELGVYDHDDDGLLEDRQLTLWDNLGGVLANVTIPAGSVSALDDSYRYQPIDPQRLEPDVEYIFADDYREKIEIIRARSVAFQTDPAVNWFEGRINASGSAAIPQSPLPSDQPGLVVNFKFVRVPEPASSGLVVIAMTLSTWLRPRSFPTTR